MARNALRHSLGGAPESWHVVEGLPGLYHPTKPVPVPTDMETAKKWHADPGCPVELVTASRKDLEQNAAEMKQLRGDLMRAARVERDVAPVVQLEAAIDAVSATH